MAKPWAKAFYRSGLWQAVRREVLRRDHYTCQDCEGRAEEVHHIIELTPENVHDRMIALNPDNLMSLCHDCHTKRTHSEGDVTDGYRFDEDGQVTPHETKR
jgi:5-methylcytosine-specific restriction enzyme A